MPSGDFRMGFQFRPFSQSDHSALTPPRLQFAVEIWILNTPRSQLAIQKSSLLFRRKIRFGPAENFQIRAGNWAGIIFGGKFFNAHLLERPLPVNALP